MPLMFFIFPVMTASSRLNKKYELLSCLLNRIAMLTQNELPGTSLVAQWLGIHMPVQGTQVRCLVREDATCLGVTQPVRHNY